MILTPKDLSKRRNDNIFRRDNGYNDDQKNDDICL